MIIFKISMINIINHNNLQFIRLLSGINNNLLRIIFIVSLVLWVQLICVCYTRAHIDFPVLIIVCNKYGHVVHIYPFINIMLHKKESVLFYLLQIVLLTCMGTINEVDFNTFYFRCCLAWVHFCAMRLIQRELSLSGLGYLTATVIMSAPHL